MAQCQYSDRQNDCLGNRIKHITCNNEGKYIMPSQNKIVCEQHFQKWLKKREIKVDLNNISKKGNIKVIVELKPKS